MTIDSEPEGPGTGHGAERRALQVAEDVVRSQS